MKKLWDIMGIFTIFNAVMPSRLYNMSKLTKLCILNTYSGSGRSAGEEIGYPLQYSWASFVAQLVKNLPALRETGFNIWVGKIPWRRERLPSPVFWPGEFHDSIVHGVAKSQTQLSDFHFTSLHMSILHQ